MAQPQRVTPVASVDPIWARIRSEAEAVVRQEPQLASFIYASLLEHDTLTGAVVHRISDRLDHPVMSGAAILQAFLDALADSPEIGDAFRADIVATYDRDPATTRFIEPGRPDPRSAKSATHIGPEGVADFGRVRKSIGKAWRMAAPLMTG